MAGSDIISALGAGSGFDTKAIVDALVAAERAPKQSQIDRGLRETEAQISAYGIVSSTLDSLRSAFGLLKDASDFAAFNVSNSSTDSFSVTASSSASPGTFSVEVVQLADKDAFASNGFSAADVSLNSGATITVQIETPSGSGSLTSLEIDSPTPQAIIEAINEADLGITATLYDTGTDSDPYAIVLNGDTGSENSFTVSTNSASLDFSTRLSSAQDAQLEIDGLALFRSTNQIDDAITGLTINITQTMTEATKLSVTRDTTAIEEAAQTLVDVYNDVDLIFTDLATSGGVTDDSGALSGDSTLRFIRNQIREMVTSSSSTASGDINYLSDIGIQITRSGTLALDTEVLADALSNSFSDVVTALSADTDDDSEIGEASRGIAGDASKAIADFLASDGTINEITTQAQNASNDYTLALAELEARMEGVYERYINQFSAMESLVDQMNSTRDFLKTTLENLPFTNRDS